MSLSCKFKIFILILVVSEIRSTATGFTADFWKSTHNKFVRGSHWENLSSDLTGKYKACSGIDLFFQTNWNLKNNPKLFDEVFDLKTFENTFNNFKEFLDEYTKISDVLRKITIEDITFGSIIKLGTKYNDVRFGVDIPIVCQVTHFWAGKKEQAELKNVISSLGASATELLPNLSFTDEETKRLEGLVLTHTKDVGLGDLRFYCEKNLLEDESSAKLVCGAEILLAIRKPDNNVPALLLENRETLTEEIVRRDILNLVEVLPFAAVDKALDPASSPYQKAILKLKNDTFTLLENFFTTLRESRLKSQIDNYRTGIGIYARPTIFSASEKVEVFARIKGNYLFSIDRMTVIPTRNYPSERNALLENIGMTKEFSPLSVLQTTLGLALHLQPLYAGVGYDFFYKSTEKVINGSSRGSGKLIEDHTRDVVDISDKLILESSEILASAQHRVFASLGYRTSCLKKDLYAGLLVNYNFHSTGSAHDSWGFTLGCGIIF